MSVLTSIEMVLTDSPGLTLDELAARTGRHKADLRRELADQVFYERRMTVDEHGRWSMGEPSQALLEVGPIRPREAA